MGQEISQTSYNQEDYRLYKQKLREETKILKKWMDEEILEDSHPLCGLELEAWLVSKDFVPAPCSDAFLKKLSHPLVVPEISKFNFELNSEPLSFEGNVLSQLEKNLKELWDKCVDEAEKQDLRAIIIGTLPSLRDHMLSMEYLSPQKRYFALNEQVMQLRGGRNIKIDMQGRDELSVEHDSVITECAATSLQIHFGVTQKEAAKYYNASIVASSFMIAACANSPYFFGKELWDESRIGIFEQSVEILSFRTKNGEFAKRVGPGNGYVRESIFELFLENLDNYPVLIPEVKDSDPEWMDHLRLHNGTIWRWNRPLIGLNDTGRPSLRLEFRTPSSGPSIVDVIANLALQIVLVEFFSQRENLTQEISFEQANVNFYSAARHGLNAKVHWIDGTQKSIQTCLLEIIEQSSDLLSKYALDSEDINKYLTTLMHQRILSGQNGASWQKAFVSTEGARFQELLERYYSYQKQNIPVHLWSV